MNPTGRPRIFISAGEPSGDLHAAAVARALRERLPDAEIDALGGPALEAAGVHVRYRMEEYTAAGLVEILGGIPRHWRLLRTLRAAFRAGAYDLVMPVDYPGFNLRVASAAHAAGVRVLYYIPPQLWAWATGRAGRLARTVDRMGVILPFEPAFYRGVGLRADYVGHPLVDRGPLPTRAEARRTLGIPVDARVLGIFPGSRKQEVDLLWPDFREAARRLLAEGRCDSAIVAGTAAGTYPDPGPIVVRHDDPVTVFAAADAALAKSGTTTLEAALADVPMVVAYRVHPVSWFLGRRLVKVPWVSLVNLVAEREVVPELLQDALSVDSLVTHARPLLDPADPVTRAQRAGLAEVRQRLGGSGAAARVAGIAAELLGR